ELLTKMRQPEPSQSGMVGSIDRRTKAKNIAGDWAAQATKIVASQVYPAVDRQIAAFKEMRPRAVHDAGVWRLPKGDQYYVDSLATWATTDKTPAEIHQIGLDVVADHTAKIDTLMKANGLKDGTVGQRLAQMYKDPKFQSPNTDAGRDKLLAD